MTPPKKKVCEHFTTISHVIKSHQPDELTFTNTYNYCTARKLRIPKRGCINCLLFKPKTEKTQ